MKVVLRDNNIHILRFDKGEEVMGGIAGYMAEQGIFACSLTGLGTTSTVELGYFNSFLKEYRKKPFIEDLEIISLIGNGSLLEPEQKPAIHMHGSFGRTDFTVIGGHVFSLIVLATCEVTLTRLEGVMRRKNNPDFNLNLLASE